MVRSGKQRGELASRVDEIVGRTWSRLSRMQSRVRSRQPHDHEAERLAWVRQHAPGHSFADIGGLFNYMGDVAFLAEDAGATKVTLFDVGDPDLVAEGHEEWGTFTAKRNERGSSVRYVQGDLEDPQTPGRIGVHDFVFYAGVLYHTPNPLLQLFQLRAITGKQALISTLTIPEIPGFPQACVFYPHLNERERRGYASGHSIPEGFLAIGTPFDDRPMFGYGNCWWGITQSALRSMLLTARFDVAEELPTGSPFKSAWVVNPLPIDPSLPPAPYFREYGEALERGEPRPSFATWYEDQRSAT
jgi:hypothetical protein